MPLAEVCRIQAGLSKRTGRESPDGTPIVMIGNIARGRIVRDGLTRIVLPGDAGMDRYQLRPDDVVCARTGDLGRSAVAAAENAGWLVGSGCLRLRPGPAVLPCYLVHYFEQPAVRLWLRASSTGSVIPNLSIRTLAEMPVAVPPIGEQRALGEVLGLLDEKIAVHEEIVRATAELRGSVARLLFAGEHPPFGPERF
ncbi:restriction endonuclease subunit S [Actinomadura sp. NPDC048394]|uniref:restriction endonuclease subunit S n=1 Tax=Actinomadura sp. NPDC048394 TaxID=3158223 RepID=UPI0033FB8D3E